MKTDTQNGKIDREVRSRYENSLYVLEKLSKKSFVNFNDYILIKIKILFALHQHWL